MSIEVADVPERSRYEARRDGDLLGYADYQLTDELMVFSHTQVESDHSGQGVGGALIRGAMDDVRARGLRALPVCPFVLAWLQRHPDYADLDYRHRDPS